MKLVESVRKNKIRTKIGFRIITTQIGEITRKKNFCHNLTQPALIETKEKDQNLSKLAFNSAILLIKLHHIASLSAHSSNAPRKLPYIIANNSIRKHVDHILSNYEIRWMDRVLSDVKSQHLPPIFLWTTMSVIEAPKAAKLKSIL
uniref:Uncharacterized protein n=1 Tax=Glossina austeni TaxID=7395 RepID=A0A1A9US64_GLOAU